LTNRPKVASKLFTKFQLLFSLALPYSFGDSEKIFIDSPQGIRYTSAGFQQVLWFFEIKLISGKLKHCCATQSSGFTTNELEIIFIKEFYFKFALTALVKSDLLDG